MSEVGRSRGRGGLPSGCGFCSRSEDERPQLGGSSAFNPGFRQVVWPGLAHALPDWMRGPWVLVVALLTAFSVPLTAASAHAARGARTAAPKKADAKARTAKTRAPAPSTTRRAASSQRLRAATQARAARAQANKKAPKFVAETADPIAALPKGAPGRVVIGVMGGAGATTPATVEAAMRTVGKTIAEGGHVTLTGAAPGLPDFAVRGANDHGGLTVGISAWGSKAAHHRSGAPTNLDVIQLNPLPPSVRITAKQAGVNWRKIPNYMGREIPNIHFTDAVIIAGGRFGTLGELAIALEERRPVGVLTGSGGIAEEVKRIVAASTRAGKPPGAPVIYDSNPERLVKRLVKVTQAHRAKRVIGPLGEEGLRPTR